MMSTIQRDAMSRAQAGDWDLADAIELCCEGRLHVDYRGGRLDLLFGIWEGGRLRRFAYGQAIEDDLDPDMVYDDVMVVTDLNGNRLYDRSRVDEPPTDPALYSSHERTPIWALKVLADYQRALPVPTQAPLIAEAA